MAYVFRIHEPKKPGDSAPASASGLSGWAVTGHIEGGLLSNIVVGTNAGKMGTSIPSLFARIFLFEGAFQALKGKPKEKLLEINADTSLVSECLDLMEFLYQHGNDERLIVKHWNAQEQIVQLGQSAYSEHRELAKVIEDEVRLRAELNDIFLFYWKDSTPQSPIPTEFLIGGTSPFTIVFTSPNWKRKIVENSFSFNRLDGSRLFDSYDVRSLLHRDADFKNMLYSLRMAYPQQLSMSSGSLNAYITATWNADVQDPKVGEMKNNPSVFLKKYPVIKDCHNANVMAYRIPICYEQVIPTTSGYQIIANSERYRKDSQNESKIPLALNENGLPGVVYVGKSVWNSQTCKINEAVVRGQKIQERTLPGQMGIQYPYLIWSDFLEDKIMKLSYEQDTSRFFFAFSGNAHYALPIKREFFKYFNITDIDTVVNNIGGKEKRLVEIMEEQNSVAVILNIPISDQIHRTIELKRVYRKEDIVDLSSAGSGFIMAFFPFYKSAQKDRYSVMLCSAGDTKLNFYNIEDLDKRFNATASIRSPKGAVLNQTEYYNVEGNFDIVEVVRGTTRGILLPHMKVLGKPTVKFSFAVDFGTSNTYIAYTTNLNATPQTLEISENDLQTVYLNKEGDFLFKTMESFFDREFAPTFIGNNRKFAYPIRTATCEVADFETVTPELFSNISMGYNLLSEPSSYERPDFIYQTKLKWLLEQQPGNVHHTNRIKYYFLQLLWTLKNKSLLNGGSDDFTVYITFPETMKQPTKAALMAQWNWAKTVLGLQCTFQYGSDYSESISPYNSLAAQIGGNSFLNMDIGGGTTDLLLVCKNSGGQIESAFYSSALFAADDLWGDGIDIGVATGGENGFVRYMDDEIQKNRAVFPSLQLSYYRNVGDMVKSSADVMGFLFKYDDIFGTSAKIASHANLYSLIFIHYAALMYNVARLIKKLNIDIPPKLSFTGMGSKYINLISQDRNVIKALTKLFLEKYTGKQVPNAFEILTNDNIDVKEITAKGALISNTLNSNFKIQAGQLHPVVDYGFDGEDNLTYQDVASADIREAVLESFYKFVDSLKDNDFVNFLYSNFNIVMSNDLVSDLKVLGEQSFVMMSANIPSQHQGLSVTETLFFWTLKNSLVELSKKYR